MKMSIVSCIGEIQNSAFCILEEESNADVKKGNDETGEWHMSVSFVSV